MKLRASPIGLLMRHALRASALLAVLAIASMPAEASAPDFTRTLHFDIRVGNIWTTMETYKAQAGALVRVRCNYCSGPQACSNDAISSGSCVPQCPAADDPNKRAPKACSFPCEALDHITTRAVEGEFRLFDALDKMLAGTGVTYALVTRSDEDMVEIVLLNARRYFDIPAGPASVTAQVFTEQSGVRILMTKELNERARTRAVQGYFTPEEALDLMLESAGLVYTPVRTPADGVFVGEGPAHVMILGRRVMSAMETLTAPQVQSIEHPTIERATFATTQDAVKTLPAMALGGTPDPFKPEDNVARGTALNLRGLGPSATLVLVNGHRQPSSGMEGDFVDVSSIPWAAVDHIEVLPDGAAATYGDGAIGGVVNIIMRKDAEGAETTLRTSQVEGGATERVISQLATLKWGTGSSLFAYQYSQRDELAFSARRYSRSADKRPLGGDDFRGIASSPGTIVDPTTLLPTHAIPSGQDGRSLKSDDLTPGANLFNEQLGSDLLPERNTHSGYLSWSQKLGDRWALNGDSRFSRRDLSLKESADSRLLNVPSSNAYFIADYSQPSALVDYNFINDLGTSTRDGYVRTASSSISLSGALLRNWQVALTGSYGQEHLDTLDRNLVNDAALAAALADSNADTAFNPFGDGGDTNPETLNKIRQTLRQRATSRIGEVMLRSDGWIARSAQGPLRFSAGISYRSEGLAESRTRGAFSSSASMTRASRSVFAELAVPVAKGLDVSLAARSETFAYSGTAFAPKVALNWSVTPFVRFRGTWGRSYRAPNLLDLDVNDRSFVALLPLSDPKSPTGRSLGLVQAGANPDLHAENANTWTAGVDFTPARTGTMLSITYFAIDYRDRIMTPGALPTINTLNDESAWANIISRNPSRADIVSLCHGPNLFGSLTDCLASTPAVVIDGRQRNGGRSRLSGFDWTIEQPFVLPLSELKFYVSGTQSVQFEQGNGSLLPPEAVLASVGNPPRTRIRASADWYQRRGSHSGFSAGLAATYVSRFRDEQRPPGTQGIRSSTTWDMNLTYRASANSRWAEGVEAILNVINVANAPPPFVNAPSGFDTINEEPFGRIVCIIVQKRF